MANNYKNRNKPNLSENSKWSQGYFYPTNKEKCLSGVNIFRSSWEESFMKWCDRNPAVVRWASEPISIKYMNPVANLEYCKKNNLNPKDPRNWKLSNYFVDFWVEIKSKNGNIKKIFIEIKPYSQTLPPDPITSKSSLKEQKSYCHIAETYLMNKAKWDAAKKYFNERGADFCVFTEHTLEKLGCL